MTRNRARGRLIRNPRKAIISTAIAALLATVLVLQATSSAHAVKKPELATSLWPGNSMAQEQLALNRFQLAVADESDAGPAARAGSEQALDAFRRFALSPKTHALLAIASRDQAEREAVLDAATRLNRRDLFLQGVSLERFVAQRDYTATLKTLDQILRVHPEMQTNFFPILDQAFAIEETVPEFDRILNGQSLWHERFLDHAVLEDRLLPNLAKLRLMRGQPDPRLDKPLIERLARSGSFRDAARIYRSLPEAVSGPQAQLDWSQDYPPFDWLLADEGRFRAQTSLDGKVLEVYARSGSGGLIAERVINPPAERFTVTIDHDLKIASGTESAWLQLRCGGREAPFYFEPFTTGKARYAIDASDAGCSTMLLGIHVRAWTGRPAVRGAIASIRLDPATR